MAARRMRSAPSLMRCSTSIECARSLSNPPCFLHGHTQRNATHHTRHGQHARREQGTTGRYAQYALAGACGKVRGCRGALTTRSAPGGEPPWLGGAGSKRKRALFSRQHSDSFSPMTSTLRVPTQLIIGPGRPTSGVQPQKSRSECRTTSIARSLQSEAVTSKSCAEGSSPSQ